MHPTTLRRTLLTMTDPRSSRPLRLESVDAATFVTSPASSRFLVPFLGRERPVAAVAREMDLAIGSVSYRVRQMLELGLIACTRVQSRPGRSIRHYCSVADEIFAPLALTALDSVRDLFSRSRSDAETELARSAEKAWLQIARDHDWGTLLYRPDPDGPANRDFVPASLAAAHDFWQTTLSPTKPAVWDQYAEIQLTHGDAKQLQRELADILTKYTTPHAGKRGSRYLLHLALAPAAT